MPLSPFGHRALRAVTGVAAALSILSMTGCIEQAEERPKQRISVTLINRYTDLARMGQDSDAIVLAKAINSDTRVRDGFPITITDLKVSKVISGELPRAAVKVQQLGTEDVESPETSRLMEIGGTYLLYLVMNDGRGNPDHFVITGGDGIYILQGHRYLYHGGPPAGPGKPLPASLAADSAEDAVTSGTRS